MPEASRTVTVKLPATPAVAGDEKPDTLKLADDAAWTSKAPMSAVPFTIRVKPRWSVSPAAT